MDIETGKLVLQALTLLAIVVGLGFTIYQLRLLRSTYADAHDWNRRKAAQDAVLQTEQFARDMDLLHRTFQIRTKLDPISLDRITKACDENEEVRTALHQRLNYFEALAIGVNQAVFDEHLIKNAYQVTFRRTLRQFNEYIENRRSNGNHTAWIFLEEVSQEWERRDQKPQPRDPLGGGP